MTVQTVRLDSFHVAHLHPLTGNGVLVLPDPATDVVLDGLHSVHCAALAQAVAQLDALGWEPTEDEYGDLCPAGTTVDGRQIVGLYGRESVMEGASMHECGMAFADLLDAAGAV